MPLLQRDNRGGGADDACGKPEIDNGQQEREQKQQQPRELVEARVLGYKRRCMIHPEITLTSFTAAIRAIQMQSQRGSANRGSSRNRQTAANAKSARVSSLAPRLLAVFVLLATKPSSMSDTPASRYTA